jgi:hypothetical protein
VVVDLARFFCDAESFGSGGMADGLPPAGRQKAVPTNLRAPPVPRRAGRSEGDISRCAEFLRHVRLGLLPIGSAVQSKAHRCVLGPDAYCLLGEEMGDCM